jgi:O-antigen/teichoic acid export membrane protein
MIRRRFPLPLLVGNGAWAVLDQGLFSGANFLLNLLLARWLVPHAYGAYTVTYLMFLLVGTFHTALLTEPMLVFGPGKYLTVSSAYLRVLLRGHWRFGLAAGSVLAIAALVLFLTDSPMVSATLLTLALASPFILLQWLLRRWCYVGMQPRLAVEGGVVYLACMLVGAFGLYQSATLSAPSAIGLMALASLVSSSWLGWRSTSGSQVISWSATFAREVVGDHWGYGRWAAASSALIWIPGSFYSVVLPVWGGLQDTAQLMAMFNLLMPAIQALTALGIVLVPTLVKERYHTALPALIRQLLLWLALGSSAYWLAISLGGPWMVRQLYGGKYLEATRILWIIGLVPISTAIVAVLGAALRAMEKPDKVFWAYVASSVATVTIGSMLIARWGLIGAAIGLAMSYAVTAATMAWFLWGSDTVRVGAATKA